MSTQLYNKEGKIYPITRDIDVSTDRETKNKNEYTVGGWLSDLQTALNSLKQDVGGGTKLNLEYEARFTIYNSSDLENLKSDEHIYWPNESTTYISPTKENPYAWKRSGFIYDGDVMGKDEANGKDGYYYEIVSVYYTPDTETIYISVPTSINPTIIYPGGETPNYDASVTNLRVGNQISNEEIVECPDYSFSSTPTGINQAIPNMYLATRTRNSSGKWDPFSELKLGGHYAADAADSNIQTAYYSARVEETEITISTSNPLEKLSNLPVIINGDVSAITWKPYPTEITSERPKRYSISKIKNGDTWEFINGGKATVVASLDTTFESTVVETAYYSPEQGTYFMEGMGDPSASWEDIKLYGNGTLISDSWKPYPTGIDDTHPIMYSISRFKQDGQWWWVPKHQSSITPVEASVISIFPGLVEYKGVTWYTTVSNEADSPAINRGSKNPGENWSPEYPSSSGYVWETTANTNQGVLIKDIDYYWSEPIPKELIE